MATASIDMAGPGTLALGTEDKDYRPHGRSKIAFVPGWCQHFWRIVERGRTILVADFALSQIELCQAAH